MVFVPLTVINSSIWVIFGLCCKFTLVLPLPIAYSGLISLLTGLCTLRWCIKLYQLRDCRPERIPLLAQTDTWYLQLYLCIKCNMYILLLFKKFIAWKVQQDCVQQFSEWCITNVNFMLEGVQHYILSLRPLFADVLFFIPTRMHFCSRTYFAIIKDLTIICTHEWIFKIKCASQFKFPLNYHGAKKCLMDHQIYAVSHLCCQMNIL